MAPVSHTLLAAYCTTLLTFGSLRGCVFTWLLRSYVTTYFWSFQGANRDEEEDTCMSYDLTLLLNFGLSRGRHAPAARGSFGLRGPSQQPTATKRSRDRFLVGPRVCVVK